MDNKKLGAILIIFGVILLVILNVNRTSIYNAYQSQIDEYSDVGESCPLDPEICPHEQRSQAMIPLYIAAALLFGIIALGIYLVYFEKSQKAILTSLKNYYTNISKNEKLNILMMGLSQEEKKVIDAVTKQEGITQQTLRLRVDMHKSKLSILLDNLEKKGLVKRVEKGKTNEIYTKFSL